MPLTLGGVTPAEPPTCPPPRDVSPNGIISTLASALSDLAASNVDSTGPNAKMLRHLSHAEGLAFYGDPMEWLHFKQAYKESSEVYHFTDKENLWRLKKCLQVPAKEAIMAVLVGATSSGTVMSTLKLQFGNPDIIIPRIMKDLSKLRPMSPEYQRKIIPFAVKVENCVATVITIG